MVALRPVVGAVRLGGRALEGATLATVDAVLGSRAATEVADRVVDSALVRAARVVVEYRPQALLEAGDLVIPIAAGEFTEDVIAGLLALA